MISSERRSTAFTDSLAARGRYHFTVSEAARLRGSSRVATLAALRRLKERGVIAEPYRGFYVIVPPEYRRFGCLPGAQFVPQLMAHLDEPYYVALLSAGEYHGAAHQRPQVFQVMAVRNRSEIRCGAVRVEFIARHNAAEMPTVALNTPRGEVRVSTPEVTAFDLVGYPQHAAGLDNVATVLTELAEVLDGGRLVAVAGLSPTPWAQRLGYLLELVGAKDQAAALAGYVAGVASYTTPLSPSRSMRGAPRDRRWRVAVNTEIEPDL